MMTRKAKQTREETILHHRERLNAVLLHIQENLDATLTIEALSAVAGFSPFHFHRIFAAYLQETVSEYVRRIRLEWAARRLIFGEETVTQIGLAAGYETPAAFGRAFKSRFNASPRTFRAQRRPSLHTANWEPLLLQPEIIRRPDRRLAYIRCIGTEADSEAVWRTLQHHAAAAAARRHSASQPDKEQSFIRVCRDRPGEGITPAERMRVDAGIVLEEGAAFQPRGPVGLQELAGGVYAVFRHQGRRHEALWQAIFKRWLPQSKVRLRDAPPYQESAVAPVPGRAGDEAVAIHIPLFGSLYDLQHKLKDKEREMAPEVSATELPHRRMISITRYVYVDELHKHLNDSFERLARIVDEEGVERDGHPVAIYHGHVNEDNNGPVEVGIPVKELPAIDADVDSGVLTGGCVAYTTLTLRQAQFPEILGYYDAVYRWMEENGYTAADPPREVYLTRPMDKEAEVDQPFMQIVWPYK
ncbi:MAG: AraC family transcriptional regulator [Caldilineaceae bacterium]|nr:AraC family transcriptional regulator [Caldilineaceae bacterium]